MKLTPFVLVALITVGIIYGSLYPFSFYIPPNGPNAVVHFLSTWRQPPQSRGDLLANILLYGPLGLALCIAIQGRLSGVLAVAVCVAAGSALSATIELTQFFDSGRVSCMSDFYLNTLGSLLGGVFGLFWGRQLSAIAPLARGGSTFVFLVLLAFLAWRLFPYAPTIDLHKYWRALKPIFRTPSWDGVDIFHYALMWAIAGYLAEFGLKLRSPVLTLPMAIFGLLVAKIFIIDEVITLPELIGAMLAVLFLLLSRPSLSAARVLTALFVLSIVLERLLPWQLSGTERSFGWIPFLGFLHGSLEVDLLSFLKKFFLYGGLLWMLVRSGLTLAWATVVECAVLLATSAVQTLLVGRSADISDALLAALIAVVYLVTADGTLWGSKPVHEPNG